MVDISLILEGTYPYTVGGVSTWVHSLITGLPEFKFAVVHLASQRVLAEKKFARPVNLVELHTIPLKIERKRVRLDELLDNVPEARIFHALSTGFAGLLGTELKRRDHSPFLLTEHGIYWHEIAMGVDELECGFKIIDTEAGPLNLGLSWQQWLDSFQNFARRAYDAADVITTVCWSNRKMQISLGAAPGKCRVVYNGVEADCHAARQRRFRGVRRIGLVGRVTPLKDIKTFIQASALIKQSMPNAEFYVIGPTEQNQRYYRECLDLTKSLRIENIVFTGQVDPAEYYRKMDIIVLTSQSEGLPFALIEAMAVGLPVVATDVGGCREVIQPPGLDGCEAGILCPPDGPETVANAVLKISHDPSLYQRFSDCAPEIVRKRFKRQHFIESYREIYHSLL